MVITKQRIPHLRAIVEVSAYKKFFPKEHIRIVLATQLPLLYSGFVEDDYEYVLRGTCSTVLV